MSVRSLVQAIVFGGLFILGATTARADVTWNAYDGFISGPTAQSASNTWQYLYNQGGGHNTGYTLLERWGDNGNGIAGNGWTSTNAADVWHKATRTN